ncbi:hypothetical protein K490DRAFT_14898, partial [Saccharata proteae CBS 121410]
VHSLDHMVLTVKSIPATVEFYIKQLGMKHEPSHLTSRAISHALLFGSQKINLHESGHEFEPKAQNVRPGSGDLCSITETPVEKVLAAFQENGFEVGRNDLSCGYIDVRGAIGDLRSVYVRDPDGNLVE